jgi:thiamine kinase-like enzyme
MNEVVQIVEKLAPELGEPEGEPTPLEGGITNRNYLVMLGGKRYVIRVPGKDTNLLGIDRGGERDANQGAAEVGIAPPVAALLTDPPALVTEFVEGTGMEAEDLQEPEALELIAGELRSYHDSSVSLPTKFDSFSLVREYAETARSRDVEPPPAYEESLAGADAIQARLSGSEHEPVPCHNDLLAGNFIRGKETIWIVDWEYAGMGDRYFDLGNFSVNNELDEAGQAALLEVYFGEEPGSRRLATLSLFRFMSDFREAMWGVVQGGVSDLDFDFNGYATKHFDRMAKTAADPKFQTWLGEAGGS